MGCLKLTYRQEGGLEKSIVYLGGSLEKKAQSEKKRYGYSPFGLAFNSFRREDSKVNDFLYNGGTERIFDFDLGWDMTPNRIYTPDLGRFWGNDALADLFPSLSPMQFGYNIP